MNDRHEDAPGTGWEHSQQHSGWNQPQQSSAWNDGGVQPPQAPPWAVPPNDPSMGGARGYLSEEDRPIPTWTMGIFEQIAVTFRVLASNLPVFLLIPLLTFLAVAIVPILADVSTGEPLVYGFELTNDGIQFFYSGSSLWWGIFIVVNLLVTLWQTILIVNAVMSAAFGRKQTIGEATAMATRDLPRVILPVIVLMLFEAAAVLGPIAMLEGAAGPEPNQGLLLLLFILQVAIFVVAVRLVPVTHTIIAEQTGPIRAIELSWARTRRRWWFVFGTLVLLAVTTFVIGAVFAPLIVGLSTVAAAFVTAIPSAASTSIILIGTTVLYINLRMTAEGFHRQIAETIS